MNVGAEITAALDLQRRADVDHIDGTDPRLRWLSGDITAACGLDMHDLCGGWIGPFPNVRCLCTGCSHPHERRFWLV